MRGTCGVVLDLVDGKFCVGEGPGHRHKPWQVNGKPMTSEEAAYPSDFCSQVAGLFSHTAPPTMASDITPALAAARPPHAATLKEVLKCGTGVQPRSGRTAPLVQEYKSTTFIPYGREDAETIDAKLTSNKGWLQSAIKVGDMTIPEGNRVLREHMGGEAGGHGDTRQTGNSDHSNPLVPR